MPDVYAKILVQGYLRCQSLFRVAEVPPRYISGANPEIDPFQLHPKLTANQIAVRPSFQPPAPSQNQGAHQGVVSEDIREDFLRSIQKAQCFLPFSGSLTGPNGGIEHYHIWLYHPRGARMVQLIVCFNNFQYICKTYLPSTIFNISAKHICHCHGALS